MITSDVNEMNLTQNFLMNHSENTKLNQNKSEAITEKLNWGARKIELNILSKTDVAALDF